MSPYTNWKEEIFLLKQKLCKTENSVYENQQGTTLIGQTLEDSLECKDSMLGHA